MAWYYKAKVRLTKLNQGPKSLIKFEKKKKGYIRNNEMVTLTQLELMSLRLLKAKKK